MKNKRHALRLLSTVLSLVLFVGAFSSFPVSAATTVNEYLEDEEMGKNNTTYLSDGQQITKTYDFSDGTFAQFLFDVWNGRKTVSGANNDKRIAASYSMYLSSSAYVMNDPTTMYLNAKDSYGTQWAQGNQTVQYYPTATSDESFFVTDNTILVTASINVRAYNSNGGYIYYVGNNITATYAGAYI